MKAVQRNYFYAMCAVVILLVFTAQAQAQYVSEAFTGNTAEDWTFIAATGDGPILTSAASIDPEGQGWLRLTDDRTNQSSFAYYNESIPTNNGMVFTFDFVTWSQTSSNADGFALVIFDAETSPVAAGGWGGSLGYAQHLNNGGLGLSGGIAGIGFDTFGNFSNPTEGRIGGPGRTPNAIALRGSMGDNRTQGYEYVTGVGDLPNFATKSALSRDDAVIHTVRLTITPEKMVSIELKPENDEWETVVDCYSCTLDCPENIKFGFTASTGGVYSYHEIRNVVVSSLEDTIYGKVTGDLPEETTVVIYRNSCGAPTPIAELSTTPKGHYSYGGLGNGRYFVSPGTLASGYSCDTWYWVDIPQTAVQAYDFNVTED